jgi:hypothetical protein
MVVGVDTYNYYLGSYYYNYILFAFVTVVTSFTSLTPFRCSSLHSLDDKILLFLSLLQDYADDSCHTQSTNICLKLPVGSIRGKSPAPGVEGKTNPSDSITAQGNCKSQPIVKTSKMC